MANETEDKELKDHREPDQSRRNFLKNSGYAVGGLIVGGVVGSLLRTPKKQRPTTMPIPEMETRAGLPRLNPSISTKR